MLKFSAVAGTYLSIILLFALPSASMAVQDETPWYPAPEDLFAPGVEVEALIVEDVPQYARPANEPQFDNEARQLRIFDADTERWLEFAYPESIPYVSSVKLYEGDVWLVSTITGRGTYYSEPNPAGQWLLNINTGVFTQPELICGELRETRADFDGRWVVYVEPSTENTPRQLPVTVELCQTKALDKRTFTLEEPLKTSGANLSPDGTKVAFVGWANYYLYDLETDMLLRLGEGHNEIRSTAWYGNDYLVISEANIPDSSPWVFISLANADQVDSLTHIGTTLKFGSEAANFRWMQNPERIEWTDYDEDEERCYFNWLERETGRQERFPIDLLCTVGMILTDDPLGDRLFDRIIYEPVEVTGSEDERTLLRPLYREVVRYNLTIGERTDLIEDEVEMIFDIDAESNYAAIVLDQDGIFDLQDRDLAPNSDVLYPETRQPHDFQFAILNLHTGEILYRYGVDDTLDSYYFGYYVTDINSATGQISSNYYAMNPLGATPTGSAFSIGNGQFIMRSSDVGRQDAPSPYRFLDDRLVEIEENEAVETILPGLTYLMTADSRQFVMVAPASDGNASVSVYDRESRLDTELISQLKIERQFGALSGLRWNDYSLGIVRGITPDVIEVSLVNNELKQQTIYRVRLPN